MDFFYLCHIFLFLFIELIGDLGRRGVESRQDGDYGWKSQLKGGGASTEVNQDTRLLLDLPPLLL